MTDTENNVELISTKPKKFCFVLMPFSDEFKDVYEIAIKEASENGGAYCERVDEQNFHETSIFQRIVNQINQADFIIADMSGKNANVFYEVGYAHALGKSTILLTNNSSDIPFDLKHFPHLIYDRNDIGDLRDRLTHKVRWFVENPVEKYGESKIRIELYSEEIPLSSNQLVLLSESKDQLSLDHNFTIHNDSSHIMEEGTYTISLISYFDYIITFSIANIGGGQTPYCPKPIALPDGYFQYTLRNTPTLLPGSYESLNLLIDEDGTNDNAEFFDDFAIEFLTENGSREFKFQVKCPTD